MKQHTVQLGTFGQNVSQMINVLLGRNPEWLVKSVFNMEVHRIGGPDNHVLVVFEASIEAPDFKEAS
jgi:hypothetical protein